MKQTLTRIVLSLVLGTTVVAVPLAAASAGGRPLDTPLTGAEEVPGPGDPDGSGTASLTVNPGTREICYTVTVEGIEPAIAAHIHAGPAGVAGPVVVPLEPPSDGSSSACAVVERTLARDIASDPTNYYVNVHNVDFPAGAVRGQLGD